MAGTPVRTPFGTVPIESLEVGDLVLSRDPHTGEHGYKPILDTVATHPDALYQLSYGIDLDGDGSLDRFDHVTTTGAHPFYVQGQNAFVDAAALRLGDEFRLADGRSAELVDVEIEQAASGQSFTTYNFEVADFHTYFVGADGVWVHNAGNGLCEEIYAAYNQILTKQELRDNPWQAFKELLTKEGEKGTSRLSLDPLIRPAGA